MREVKIFGETYEVIEQEIIDNMVEKIGLIDHMQNKIYIKKSLSEDKKKVTLIHEILHGILSQLGFDDEHDNEHLIDSLSTAIYQVFKSNSLL